MKQSYHPVPSATASKELNLHPPLFASPTLRPASSRKFQGIPGIERSSGHRLWATWYAGGEDRPGEGPGNYVILSFSDNEGESWVECLHVVPADPLLRCFDPCLWTDPRGRLWFFWAQSQQLFDGIGGVWAMVCADPNHVSPHWSQPIRIADGIMMNKPIASSRGEWFLPVSIWPSAPVRHFDCSNTTGAGVVVSSDEGQTWSFRGRAFCPSRIYDEHMLIERRNGDLWMLIRTETGAIAESISSDEGRTWSAGQYTSIPHVNSRFFVRRLQSGRLLIITHHPLPNTPPGNTRDIRSNLKAWLSDNDGASWYGGLLIDARPGISYPDGVESQDGTITVIYDRDRYGPGDILVNSFQENDIIHATAESSVFSTVKLVSRME